MHRTVGYLTFWIHDGYKCINRRLGYKLCLETRCNAEKTNVGSTPIQPEDYSPKTPEITSGSTEETSLQTTIITKNPPRDLPVVKQILTKKTILITLTPPKNPLTLAQSLSKKVPIDTIIPLKNIPKNNIANGITTISNIGLNKIYTDASYNKRRLNFIGLVLFGVLVLSITGYIIFTLRKMEI